MVNGLAPSANETPFFPILGTVAVAGTKVVGRKANRVSNTSAVGIRPTAVTSKLRKRCTVCAAYSLITSTGVGLSTNSLSLVSVGIRRKTDSIYGVLRPSQFSRNTTHVTCQSLPSRIPSPPPVGTVGRSLRTTPPGVTCTISF